MALNTKIKKRGFVMTGGGAKGFYEAGVIHAFHITGMEFDVVTGSSIGAMNGVFFAEYLYQKRTLMQAENLSVDEVIARLDPYILAFHHAWLQLPDKKLIDDSDAGALGQLKNDLLNLNISLPLVLRLGWWWTDPDRTSLPPLEAWPSLARLVRELVKGLGGAGRLLQIFKLHRDHLVEEIIRTYLRKLDMEQSLIPASEDHKLKDVFTQPVSPLKESHLTGDVSAPDRPGEKNRYVLVDPNRTFRDYYNQNINVRVTRANYRTGRLEISAYVPLPKFFRFLEKQAWRVDEYGPDQLPLGSFRIQVPGNPNAVNAGLCSGRFPGVFRPFPIEDIYPSADPDNRVLYQLLASRYSAGEMDSLLVSSRAAGGSEGLGGDEFEQKFARWRKSKLMSEFFPRSGDLYVDGGSIDNTPSNSAVDYMREWTDSSQKARRDVQLDLFVIYLDTEPKVGLDTVPDPAIYKVVNRTLAIQGTAKATSDTNTVDTINAFGWKSENLALVLQSFVGLSQAAYANVPVEQRQQVEADLFQRLVDFGVDAKVIGNQPDGILERMQAWVNNAVEKDLPLHVELVKVYPGRMPLDTLQFTERLGYQKANAIEMLTMGCSDTLWALRNHLETHGDPEPDSLDQQVLERTRKVMGYQPWPKGKKDQEGLRANWKCQQTNCIYYQQFCALGARNTRTS